jgi:hypothetical protein
MGWREDGRGVEGGREGGRRVPGIAEKEGGYNNELLVIAENVEPPPSSVLQWKFGDVAVAAGSHSRTK